MAKRNNHYEAAFEAYLRWLGVPYVAVDETHRSLLAPRGDVATHDHVATHPLATHPIAIHTAAPDSLKSVDFIVSPRGAGESWLVDVKGRRFPTGASYWKNWSTADELLSLAAWEALFGSRFVGLLVFAYNVVGDRAPLASEELFVFRGGLYGFVGVRLEHYTSWSKRLSPRWGTVSVPVSQFKALARPVRELWGVARPQAA